MATITKKSKNQKPGSNNVSPQTTKLSLPKGEKGSADGAEYLLVNRKLFHNAPYNPRKIDPVSAKKLKESIENTGGLVQAPLWNKRTGNLIAGHQRINQTDLIKKTNDYTVITAVVDWPIEKEIEVNLRLNNPSNQGEYDLPLVDTLLANPDIDILNTGFDITTLELWHRDIGLDLPEYLGGITDPESEESYQAIARDIEEIEQEVQDAKEEEIEQRKIEEIKERKKEFAERQNFLRHGNNHSHVVFPTDGTRKLFMDHLQLDPDGEYVDGMTLLIALGLEEEANKIIESEKPKKRTKSQTEDLQEASPTIKKKVRKKTI